jgi:hypothetical protein
MWIKDIVESTLALPFLTNFKVHMTGFMDSHKVIARKNAISAHTSAQNENENFLKKMKKKNKNQRLI